MCFGSKRSSDAQAAATATPPPPRVTPQDPDYGPDMLRDPAAAMARIAGVHTSSQGVTTKANVGRTSANGKGTANPAGMPDFVAPMVKPGGVPVVTPSTPLPKPPKPVLTAPQVQGGARPRVPTGPTFGRLPINPYASVN